MSEPIDLTWYRNARDARRGVRMRFDGAELAANIAGAGPHAGPKGDLPLVCPATFRGEHRGNERVEVVTMLGLDIDDPQADPAAYVARLVGALGHVEAFVYSTASSVEGAWKLRALIPYDRPATADEHRASWALVARVLGRHGIAIDRACSDPARGFYVWAVPASGAYYHVRVEGEPWPVSMAAGVEREYRARLDEAVRRDAEERARRYAAPGGGMPMFERARRYIAAMPIAIQGAKGSDATFAVARKLIADFGLPDEQAWILLGEHSARCRPPWNEKELRHKLASAKRARVANPVSP